MDWMERTNISAHFHQFVHLRVTHIQKYYFLDMKQKRKQNSNSITHTCLPTASSHLLGLCITNKNLCIPAARFSPTLNIMTNIEDLTSAIKNFNESIVNVKIRREKWNNELREMIKTILSEVTIECTSLHLEEDSEIENFDFISVSFQRIPSGIMERTSNGFTNYALQGGTLSFNQRYNGQILVVHVSPYVENITRPDPIKILEILNPDQITSDKILQLCIDFIVSETLWHQGKISVQDIPRVGF